MQQAMHETSPTVSVVIPTFNRVATLGRAIDSVLAQSRPADEIIVVDDGSDDETAELLQQYTGLLVLKQANAGVSAARNLGIRHATSDWIALLDSDDQWLEHKLQLQMQAIKGVADAVLCHCNENWIRNGKHLNQANKHKKNGGWIFKHCLPLCAISPSAAVIKKSLFDSDAIGLFDTALPACEDYDMWLRICSKWPVIYIEKPLLNKFGGHDDQLSKRFPAMDQFRIRALENILRQGNLPADDHSAALDTLIKKANVYINGARKRDKHKEAQQLEQRIRDLTGDLAIQRETELYKSSGLQARQPGQREKTSTDEKNLATATQTFSGITR